MLETLIGSPYSQEVKICYIHDHTACVFLKEKKNKKLGPFILTIALYGGDCCLTSKVKFPA